VKLPDIFTAEPPIITTNRVWLAYTVAVTTDALQLIFTFWNRSLG